MANQLLPWSIVLQNVLRVPAERKRLAAALGMSDMTLTRWSNGESTPQRPHLVRLVQVLQPQHREEIVIALKETYPDIHIWLNADVEERIAPDFFAQVLNVRTTTTESLRFWRISEMVLKQALLQLDPNNLGMSVKLIQCMPPVDGKIRSIRECAGRGTPPWTDDLEHDVLFLGLESMSGYATETRHFVSADDLRKNKIVPAFQGDFEISAVAHPIRNEGRVAGCLLASSTQEAYFTQQRIALAAVFADLISLAFDKKDFYPSSCLQLRFMPPAVIQKPIIATFRERVTRRFRRSGRGGSRLSNPEIELAVWQEIEEELLSLPDETIEPYLS
jgi:transcriptional regulator with XRE-family HTH domain